MNLTQTIKAKANALGFAKIGISPAERLDERNGLEQWLADGNHGQMSWMGRDSEKRMDPRRVFLEAKSVITLALNYYSPERHSENPEHGKISRYAWGRDYHLIFKELLKTLAEWIVEQEPSVKGLYYSDTGPLMDKAWAHKSGIGWIGKHSNLITREVGSWVFLGEILLNVELSFDNEDKNYCGTCHRCMEVCPTKAIVAPYIVDARLCISYLTIELRGPIPLELRPLIGSRIFGCDDCQDVCPWNRFAQPSLEKDFYPVSGNHVPVLIDLMQMSEGEFKERFRSSAIKRAKYAGFLRNVAVALGNSRNSNACSVLADALHHPEPLVRAHAAWALGEIGGEESESALKRALPTEKDLEVIEEIHAALREVSRAVGGKQQAVGC